MQCKICHKFVRKKNLRSHKGIHNDPKAMENYQRSKSGKHSDECTCVKCKRRKQKQSK